MDSLPSDTRQPLGGLAQDQLYDEILKCPADTLRVVLQSLCESSDIFAHTLRLALCIDRQTSIPKESASPTMVLPVIGLKAPEDVNDQDEETVEDSSVSSDSSKKRKATESPASAAKRARIINLARGQLHYKDRYVHCINCYELFDVLGAPCHDHDAQEEDSDSDNDDSDTEDDGKAHDCCYHSGFLDVNYDDDCWADHDEDIHGEIDSDELRQEYPENYTWNCCNQNGDAKGCKKGRHKAGKKLNYSARLNKSAV